jgi:hypothetical protein
MSDMPPDAVAAIDQMGAALAQIAEATIQYRRALVDGGVGEEAADSIVQDLSHRLHLTIFPPTNPLADLFGKGGST